MRLNKVCAAVAPLMGMPFISYSLYRSISSLAVASLVLHQFSSVWRKLLKEETYMTNDKIVCCECIIFAKELFVLNSNDPYRPSQTKWECLVGVSQAWSSWGGPSTENAGLRSQRANHCKDGFGASIPVSEPLSVMPQLALQRQTVCGRGLAGYNQTQHSDYTYAILEWQIQQQPAVSFVKHKLNCQTWQSYSYIHGSNPVKQFWSRHVHG